MARKRVEAPGGLPAEHIFIHCAVETCPTCAMVRVKTPTGWANFCLRHYDEYHARQARDWCLSRGLDTREKQYHFMRSKMLNSKLFEGIQPMRQPGEDTHEEVYGEVA